MAEQSSGQELYNGRVRPISNNGGVQQFLIQQTGELVPSVEDRTPDIPHIHSLMEVPKRWSSADFALLCQKRWFQMNKVDIYQKPNLARVEVVRDLPAVARYITKDFVKTQGANIILTHATLLR
ncbi:MAG: hypothetical protein SGJ16_10310 [Nitrospirota bacterium]|nr:hypothetical protein [Nitrospirota bacterium]